MKHIVIIVIIIFGSLQCSGNNKQRAVSLQEQHSNAVDSAVIKNDMAVQIYMNARGNVDSLQKAIELLDEVIAFNPKFRIAYSNKIQYLSVMGKNEDAMVVIEEALRNLPDDPQLYFIKGVFYKKSGLPDLAKKSFHQSILTYDKLITSDPDDFNLLLNRAFVCIFTETSESTLEELENLKSKYGKDRDEYSQIQNLIEVVYNTDKEDYIRDFWSQ